MFSTMRGKDCLFHGIKPGEKLSSIMGALEKVFSIVMICIHVGLLIAALVSASAPWYATCALGICFQFSTLSRFESVLGGELGNFFWVSPPFPLDFSGVAAGGAISMIALIVIMVIEVLAIVAHVLRLTGKTVPTVLRGVANWSFVAVAPLALMAVLSFPIAFGTDGNLSTLFLRAGQGGDVQSGVTATTGVGVTVLIIVIAVVNILLRFIPIVNAKTRYSNAVI
jgi:hypothetical protein